ncbi:MAG TPA: LuxR C-terminal-related transcriptional regulator [Chloroflexota bacterium]
MPLQLTSFVGRTREFGEARALLRRTRLLTLTGTGGIGKTRLALEVAAGLVADYPEGVWFVDLAPLGDPRLVAGAIAEVGGVSERPGVPTDATLVELLGDRQILLLLDNCEHLVVATAHLADTLLRACSGLRILATTRELLGIAGEVILAVPPLTLPPADATPTVALAESEAVRLFEDRAAAAQPEFELTRANVAAVVRVCRRLDGLALAIELAAARLRTLTPEQIADRLDDRFALLTRGNRAAVPRQQTLEATIVWSYDLLTEPERALFRQLSVFSGGWTLSAAESVCCRASESSSESPRGSVFDTLTRLVDQSLVLVDIASGDARYRFLETIRQYAHDRLLEAGREADEVSRAHAQYFLALAEAAEPWLYTSDGPSWMAQLTTEHDNMRAAYGWALEAAETDVAVRLGASLYRFWRQRGHVREGREWLAQALAAGGTDPPEHRASQLARARALNGAGVLARGAGDFVAAWPLLAESLALFETLGDEEQIANVEQNLGHVLFRLGERNAARAHLQSGLARLRRLDTESQAVSVWMFGCLNVLGMLALQEGDLATALAHAREAEACSRLGGSPHFMAHALIELGVVHLTLAEPTLAAPVLREALALAADAADRWCTLQALHALACVNAATGKARRAAVLTAAFRALGDRVDPGDISADLVLPALEVRLNESLAALDPLVRAAAESEGVEMSVADAVAFGLADTDQTAMGDPPRDAAAVLSRREREVARLIARGYTSRQIGEALVIAEPTAERHTANIFVKLGIHSRAQVAAWAAAHLGAGMYSRSPALYIPRMADPHDGGPDRSP